MELQNIHLLKSKIFRAFTFLIPHNFLKNIFSFLAFFLLLNATVFAQNQSIQINTKDVPLTVILNELEQEYGFLSTYSDDAIAEEICQINIPKSTIQNFLHQLLTPANLEYEIVDKRYIIITQKSNTLSNTSSAPPSNFCGKVIDAITKEPLIAANIYLKTSQKGNTSNEQGDFQFKYPLQAKDSLIISYIGYQAQSFLAREFIRGGCPTIALSYLDFEEDFIVVTDYLSDGISLHEHGNYTEFQPDRIAALPGQIEADVMKSIQFLPGISSPDGTAGGLNIRGGTADQNLVLWEDIPIYHTAHYFGMISAFNPSIIDNVSVYKGGFDATYGGRISGVIDLKTDHSSNDEKLAAGINFINAYVNGKQSLFNNRLKFTFSLRHSVPQKWRTPTFDNITERNQQGVLLQIPVNNQLPPEISIQNRFSFLDTNAKLSYQLSAKDKISAAVFYGNNDFKAEVFDGVKDEFQNDTLFLRNDGLSLNWKRKWSDRWSTKLLYTDSDYEYKYDYSLTSDDPNLRDQEGRKENNIEERQLQLATFYQSSKGYELNLGVQSSNYYVRSVISRQTNQNDPRNTRRDTASWVQVAYANIKTPSDKKLGLEAGVRLSYFDLEKEVYFEPRIRLWTKPSKSMTFYVNGGIYQQFLSQVVDLEGDNSSIETPVWVLAGSKEVPVLQSRQLQVGGIYTQKGWLLDVQAYLRGITGLSSSSTGFDEDFSEDFKLGEATIKGLDVLVKKRWKDYQTWMSYTLSQVDHHFPKFFDPNFPAPNDQRHVFNWVHLWKVNNFDVSLGWSMHSGLPHPDIDNFEIRESNDNQDRFNIRAEVDEFNTLRLPNFHHLDASVSYTFRPKQSKLRGLIGLSFYNIYQNNNLYHRELFIRESRDNPPRLVYLNKSDLPFTPNLVVQLMW